MPGHPGKSTYMRLCPERGPKFEHLVGDQSSNKVLKLWYLAQSDCGRYINGIPIYLHQTEALTMMVQ